MAKRKKRLAKIRQNPKNVRFEELDRVLRDYGFERRQPRSGSSHYFYFLSEHRRFLLIERPFVKRVYVKRALSILEEIDRES